MPVSCEWIESMQFRSLFIPCILEEKWHKEKQGKGRDCFSFDDQTQRKKEVFNMKGKRTHSDSWRMTFYSCEGDWLKVWKISLEPLFRKLLLLKLRLFIENLFKDIVQSQSRKCLETATADLSWQESSVLNIDCKLSYGLYSLEYE